MENYKKTTVRAVLGVSAMLFGAAAQAVPLSPGCDAAKDTCLTGTFVSYSFNSADLGAFGSASVAGDTLAFAPIGFQASSASGGAKIETLHVTVIAHSGYQLSAFNLAESGAYSLAGAGSSAFVTGKLIALDIEGTTSNQVIGTIAPTAPLNVTGATTGWTANAGVVLPGSGWGGADGVVGSISLEITNQLFAVASPLGGAADIWKNSVGVNVVATPVPEAETYAMMLAGLGLVGFAVRRRTRSPV